MKTLEIVTGENNPILRNVSVEVKKFDSGLKKLAKMMKATMEKANGLGIAAPQVAENIRLIIVTFNLKTKNELVLTMVNPEIVWHGEEVELGEEGCLSLPGIYDKVERHREIKVEFRDVDGVKQNLRLEGMNARVVQHEVDHINGILFIDRVRELREKAQVM